MYEGVCTRTVLPVVTVVEDKIVITSTEAKVTIRF